MRLIDLDSLPRPSRPVRLTCWFDSYIEKREEDATLYLVLRDSSGEQDCLLDNDSLGAGFGQRLPANCLVDVDLEFLPHLPRNIPRIRCIAPAAIERIGSAAAVLPLDEVPERARPAFQKLIEFNDSLRNPFLRGFVNRVLLDPQISLGFLKATNTRCGDAADTGGLLIHSTDQLDAVGVAARQAFPRTPTAVVLTQIAYLFHDLGKVVTHHGSYCSPQRTLRPSSLTSILLQPHLYWLSRFDVKAALAIQTVLDAFDHVPAPGYRFQFGGTPIVQACDMASMGASSDPVAFEL